MGRYWERAPPSLRLHDRPGGAAMQKDGLTKSACLIAAVGAVAAAAIGFSTWRYDVALSRGAGALRERTVAAATLALSTTFWHERQAIGQYAAAASPAVLGAVITQHGRFQRLATQLAPATRGARAPAPAPAAAAAGRDY